MSAAAAPNAPMKSARVSVNTAACAIFTAGRLPSTDFRNKRLAPIEHGSMKPISPKPSGSRMNASYIARRRSCCSQQTSAVPDHVSVPSRAAGSEHHEHSHESQIGAGASGRPVNENHERARDPVCGMSVDPHTTPHRYNYAGETYYFCSAGCLVKFSADPQKFTPRTKRSRPKRSQKGRFIPVRCTAKSARSGQARHGA